MWHVTHLNERKMIEYLNDYADNTDGEPIRKWRNTLQRCMRGGTVSIDSIQPIL